MGERDEKLDWGGGDRAGAGRGRRRRRQGDLRAAERCFFERRVCVLGWNRVGLLLGGGGAATNEGTRERWGVMCGLSRGVAAR